MSGRALLVVAVAVAMTRAVVAAPVASPAAATKGTAADTLTALLGGGTGTPAPAGLLVWPDSVAFGQPVWVACVPSAGQAMARPGTIGARTEWLAWEACGEAPRAAAVEPSSPPRGWPPAASGARLVGRARIYRAGAVRLGWDGGAGPLSAVITVRPRLPADASPAPVRDPRGLGWRRGRLALLALIALALLGLFWRRRRRLSGPAAPADAPLSPPAYLAAACALWALHEEGLLERGDGRRFLDRLSTALRGYLHARYHVPAEARTPDEIARDLAALRHPAQLATGSSRLLCACDEQRFGPYAASPVVCRTLLRQAIGVVDEGRVPARFTPVPPPLALAGEAAWSRLRALVDPLASGRRRHDEEGRGA